jgi:hypothetical protein
MIPVQYRDPETEEVLDRRYEEEVPEIGQTVMLDGVWECEVVSSTRGRFGAGSPLRHRRPCLGLFSGHRAV